MKPVVGNQMRTGYIFAAFGLGVLSALIAGWGELGLTLNTLPYLLTEPTAAMLFLAVFVAPLVEELAKPLGLYLIHGEERPNLTVQQWTVLGAVAGFGFMVIENIMYAASTGFVDAEAGWLLLGLRFMLPLHIIASALAGFGFGLWAKTSNAKYFFVCIWGAMLLHALFNLAAMVVG